MPGPLEAQLLVAAYAAYDIRPPGGPEPLPPPGSGLSNVASVTGGPDNIDGAFIADSPDGMVLSFRGTFPPTSPDHEQTVLDWLNDADALFVNGGDLPGRLHKGFSEALNILWPPVKAALLDRAGKALATTPVYVTGHSKGGAIAFPAAMRCQAALAAAGLRNPVMVCTFAAARPGDQIFADGFDKAIPHAVRFEYGDDIVPHLPPENVLRLLLMKLPDLANIPFVEEGFVSPGTLRYLPRGSTPSTVPESDSPLLKIQRLSSLVTRVARLDFETIVRDHSIDPGSGYATAIAGTAISA